MDALLTSAALVAIAEIGDKTQLLALVLAARFARPIPIAFGILIATLANHFLAALVGQQAAVFLGGQEFRYIVAISFIVMAGWALIPDKLDDEDNAPATRSYGAFLTTLVAFFLVEMGDKTQIATIALGARFESIIPVMLGTTIGMMIANVPVVFLGDSIVKRISLRYVRAGAALLFLAIGLWLLIETVMAS